MWIYSVKRFCGYNKYLITYNLQLMFKQRSFTLIELLVVIAVIGVLAALVMPNLIQARAKARDARRLSDLDQLAKAMELYFNDHNHYPIWESGCLETPNNPLIEGTPSSPAFFTSQYMAKPAGLKDPLPSKYCYYYKSDSTGGNFKIAAYLEKDTEKALNDNGTASNYYEVYQGPTGSGSAIEIDNDTLAKAMPGYVSTVTVTAINPASGVNNASVTLTSITGTGFASGATVKLTKSGQTDISCTGFTVASSVSITGGSCPITGAAVGTWNVVVTNTDTGAGSLANGLTITAPWACGDTVTFTYKGGSVTYGTVSHNSECWLDRNLGASQVATAYNNSAAYGDLFQWGRLDDSHQTRTSGTTDTLSSTDNPGHSNFIKAPPNTPCDWRSPQNDSLWQGVSGTNNPCPAGWRIPTSAEWNTERASWTQQNYNGAFASPLKLTASGFRYYIDASLNNAGSSGHYWSSSVSGTGASGLHFYSSGADVHSSKRALGFSVRCLKD